MARAETIESVGEPGGGGGNGPLPGHNNTCRMELPRPLHTWPSLLTTTITTGTGTGAGAIHFHHNPHHLQPLQALYLPYPLPYPDGRDEPRAHLPSATSPPALLCNPTDERSPAPVAPGDFSLPDSDSEEHLPSWPGPLPDLLPQNEHPSWASPHHRAPGQELEVRRVASHLRAIGDEFNATVLRRAHGALLWQDWGDVGRGLLNFITQMLSTLYRLT
ncbi:bcl-2-binding component 3 [Brachyistius frenatus]|uniref:bcl-2-binding component 3 n=1 Tax=Brachyistius frenatus TaxID=100188 RepID=UPI0037E8F2E8